MTNQAISRYKFWIARKPLEFPLLKDRVQIPENLDAVFAALAKHGTIVWVYLQSKDFKNSDPAGDAVAVPDLQSLADRAAKHNIKLALYPHAGFWAQSYPDCVRIARAVRRPNFGVSFNLCHVLKTGNEKDIPKLLRESQPLLFIVTLNGADADVAPAAGWDRLIQPVGQGTYDLVPLLKTLREIDYAGPIGFQGYGIPGDRREILQATMSGWIKINAGQ